MPAIETDGRHQKAVYWKANGVDRYGNAKVDKGIELDVRLVKGRRRAFNAQGQPVAIDATVVLDRDVPTGSLFWVGTLLDLPDELSDLTDLLQVASIRETPDVKGREVRREAMLVKFKDSLPTVNETSND